MLTAASRLPKVLGSLVELPPETDGGLWRGWQSQTSCAQVVSRENSSHHPLCTALLNTFFVVSHSCMVAEHLILAVGSWVVMVSAQQVEMLKRQFDDLTAQMSENRQQSSSTANSSQFSKIHVRRKSCSSLPYWTQQHLRKFGTHGWRPLK